MLENARRLATEYHMLPPGATVLCAVSGGADSICLLHWLHHLHSAVPFSLVAAHFNHQLRGEESDADETFVRDLCAQWGIPLTVGRGDAAAFSAREGLSIEEGARTLRYAFLAQAAEAEGCALIATAHNADDNAETVLLHLLRGTGLAGLTGIPPVRGNIVRPFLSTKREEILAYLDRNQLPHVEDSSNQSDAFLRNRVRRQLVPLLDDFNPGFVDRMTAAIPRLRADNEYLDALAADLSQKAVVEDGTVSLPALFVSGVPGPVAVRVVRQLIAMTPVGSTDCAAAHLEAVTALCRSDHPSGEVHLPHGLTARRVYGALVLTHTSPPAPLVPFAPVQGENPVAGTPWTAVLTAPPWPGLVVRPRRTGDRITLPGRPERTVKKLLIDEKVPRLERELLPLAADANGVLALAGFGVNTAHPKSGLIQFKKTGE